MARIPDKMLPSSVPNAFDCVSVLRVAKGTLYACGALGTAKWYDALW